MIWTIIGNTKEARQALSKIREALKKKQPDALELYWNEDTFYPEAIDEALQSQGLFLAKHIAVFDQVLDKKEYKELVFPRLAEFKESSHACVMTITHADAKTKAELNAHSFDVKDMSSQEEVKGNSFALAEALGKRDSKHLWHIYIERLAQGASVEEMCGQLMWQAKSMLLATITTTPEEALMKEFPYKKAKSFARNYETDELKELIFNMASLYHRGHQGKEEMETGLEALLLEI